jgi:hypothetical protein
MRRVGSILGLALSVWLTTSCAPEGEFENPCDPQYASYDPCACKTCPANSSCQVAEGRAVCTCGNPAGWCIDLQVCCLHGEETCRAGECCRPQCTQRTCGDDGCGGSCGQCAGCGNECQDGNCVFLPCSGIECGPNACGGAECGTCPVDQDCSAGKCVAKG